MLKRIEKKFIVRQLSALIIGGIFCCLFLISTAQAANDYAKPTNGTLGADEWNNLLNDFANTFQSTSMVGPLQMGSNTAPSYDLLSLYGNTGDPASSGGVQLGIFRISNFQNTQNLSFGQTTGSPFISWIQNASYADLSTGYPISLNPRGGNIGINKLSPLVSLDINGAVNSNNTITASSFCLGGVCILDWPVGGGPGGLETDYFWSLSGSNLYASSTSWNIGIGTTSPSAKLDVAGGNIDIDNTTYAAQNGVITKNGERFIHDFNYGYNGTVTTLGQNTFVGYRTGNLTMGSTATTQSQGSHNTAVGSQVLTSNTTGYQNSAVGVGSLTLNTTGYSNSALGVNSLNSNTTGFYNAAVGGSSLQSNTTGNYNSAFGAMAMTFNNIGVQNTAVGAQALIYNTGGSSNSALGVSSLYSNTTGATNSAVGNSALYSNTTGAGNTAIGMYSLTANITGNYNLALGNSALSFSKAGSNGVAIGYEAMKYANDVTSTWTNYNTAIGYQALLGSTTASVNTGNFNTVIGYRSLVANTTGSYNLSLGMQSLYYNTTGHYNSAVGPYSLYGNKTGEYNSAVGYQSLYSNTSGSNNSLLGRQALIYNTTGSFNVAIGSLAGMYLADGATANQTPSNSVYLGASIRALASSGTNEIIIGDSAIGLGSNSVVLGNDSIITTVLKGKVGLGITGPTNKLDIVGTVASNNSITATSFCLGGVCIVEWPTGGTGTSTGNYLPLSGGTMAGAIDMGLNNITNINNLSVSKITATTIDPLYKIKGINYSTFAASIAGGVKEELVGKIKLTTKNKLTEEYEAIIDFSSIKEGSDLWVWRQVVDFSSDNVDVFLTPYGRSASVYYLVADNSIIFRSDKPADISYRLIGKRFDWRNWPTKAQDQTEAGFEVK